MLLWAHLNSLLRGLGYVLIIYVIFYIDLHDIVQQFLCHLSSILVHVCHVFNLIYLKFFLID